MTRFSTHCLILAATCAVTPAVASQFYTLTITGAIDRINVDASLQSDFDSVFSIGDPLLFNIVYNAGASSSTLNNIAEYESPFRLGTVSISDYEFFIDRNPPTEEKDKEKEKDKKGNSPAPPTTPAPTPTVDADGLGLIQLINRPLGTDDAGDEFNILLDFSNQSPLPLAPVGTAIPHSFSISLQDPTDAAFSGAGAPPSLSAVTDFSVFTTGSGSTFQFVDAASGAAVIGFEITSVTSPVIPEPSSLALLGLGVALIAARRKRTFQPNQPSL